MIEIDAIIEIPKHSIYKYELKNKKLILDRIVNQPYPSNYGFIEKTLCEDKDPLDIFIMSTEPIIPGTKVLVDIIGGYECKDGGVQDDKLIAIIHNQPFFDDIRRFFDEEVKKIQDFLNTYKEGFEIIKPVNSHDAVRILVDAQIKFASK